MSTESNDSKDPAGHTSPTEAKDEALAQILSSPSAPPIKHGDHLDTLTTYSPWTCVFNGGDCFDWFDRWVEVSDSWAFKKMVSWRPQIVEYTQKLASLKRKDMVEFTNTWDRSTPIPLFKDPESGDEYHIDGDKSINLPQITCPSIHLGLNPTASPLFLLQSRGIPPSAARDLQPKQERKPPRYAVHLGCLKVRTTTSRGLQLDLDGYEEPPPVTEKTDWNVILDVEDENYPLWIVASRQQLKDHYYDRGEDQDEPLFPLPVFRGLLGDEDADYDCACILDSVHRLGMLPAVDNDNPRAAPDFESEVLAMIRSTRCIIDPVHHPLPSEQLTRYANKEPFDHPEPAVWPVDPDFEVKITHVLVYDDDAQQELWYNALEKGQY